MVSGLTVRGFPIGCLSLPYVAEAPLLRHSVQVVRLSRFERKSRLFATYCSTLTGERKKVVVVSGPTGAGKSWLAMELPKKIYGEIVSADSIQVYRGLDVGSAKPSLSERQEVPHHLIDILNPFEDYSVGQFYEDARQITKEILSRGRVPAVRGGTGLYLRWFIYEKPDVPKASSEVTSEVHSELADLKRTGDWDAAVQFVVKTGDPDVQSLAANDCYRLRRRLEILKMVEFYRRKSGLIGLGLMPNSSSATRAIGYRQATDFLLMSREQGGWISSKELRVLSISLGISKSI